jgi:thiamine-phosphate pyrophosphorylase
VAGKHAPLAGLYAVTPDTADTPRLLTAVEAALAGGAGALQYRNKSAGAELRRAQAKALLPLCRRHRVPLIINDHLELALELDADGLHIGGEDGSAAAARQRLGAGKILGVSCYGRIASALAAAEAGATYVAFGGFFPSKVKPGAARTPVDLLREAKRALALPVVAIGGITLVNAPSLIAAGADAVAVISALFEAPDVRAAARDFSTLFERGRAQAMS